MPTLADVYARFGQTAEAAQLLETELGNVLLEAGLGYHNLVEEPNPHVAQQLVNEVNKKTLGQLVKAVQAKGLAPTNLQDVLLSALEERNRLNHAFYREHNFRRNSEEGRAQMLLDLESIHHTIMQAYKALMLLSGVDLTDVPPFEPPTGHVPI